jgi:hypothetical protein
LIQPSIDFFEKNKDKYKGDDKPIKKLHYACVYNLALIHYWLEDFEKAGVYANQLITDDYEPKDGKKMLKNIEELKEELKKSDKKSCHFKVEIDEKGAEDAAQTEFATDAGLRVEAYKDAKKGLKSTSVEYPGFVKYEDGREVNGTFIVDDPNLLAFEANVRFAIELNKDVNVKQLNYSKISQFSFNDRLFKCAEFKSANELGGSRMQIMEVIYTSPKVVCYLIYADKNRSLTNPPEYAMYKVADLDYTSLNSAKFALNLDKGIRKGFAECPDVVAATEVDGGFKRTPTQMIRLAKMLEACW